MRESFGRIPISTRVGTNRYDRLVASNRERKRIIKLIAIVAANIVAVAAVLFAFEFAFSPHKRLPVNGWEGDKLYTWGHLVETNKYGFRERDFEIPKPAGTYRIMVLGDSLTWGAGLATNERYTAVAEALLRNWRPADHFEVLNFGVSGSPTVRERDVLSNQVDVVGPDLIVVGFCLNDPQPKPQDYSPEKKRLWDSWPARMLRALVVRMQRIGLSYTGKTLNDVFYKLAEAAGTIPTWEAALNRAYDPSCREWMQFTNALADIKAISDQRGLRSPMFMILNQGGRAKDYVQPNRNIEIFRKWYQAVQEAADKAGFVCWNHEADIAALPGETFLTLNKVDSHPSAVLNQVYGRRLFETVSQIVGAPDEPLVPAK